MENYRFQRNLTFRFLFLYLQRTNRCEVSQLVPIMILYLVTFFSFQILPQVLYSTCQTIATQVICCGSLSCFLYIYRSISTLSLKHLEPWR